MTNDSRSEQLKVFAELYASLNRDYVNLGVNEISYGSPVAETQRKRRDIVWNLLMQVVEPTNKGKDA